MRITGEDELARYEDENESDMSFMSSLRSSSTSSLFDTDDLPRSTSHLCITDLDVAAELPSRSPTMSPIPLPNPWDAAPAVSVPKPDPKHSKNASLSRTWTFPRNGQSSASSREDEEVDRFFGCLDDVEDIPALDKLGDKSVFSRSLHIEEEDGEESFPPFVLPSQKSPEFTMLLDVVLEEDEEENEDLRGEEVEGGIKFSFPSIVTPPAKQESKPITVVPISQVSRTSVPSSPQIQSTFTIPSNAPSTPQNQRIGSSAPRQSGSTRIPPPSPPRFSKQQSSKPDVTPTAATSSKRPPVSTTYTPAPKSSTIDKAKQSNDAKKKSEKPIVSTPVAKSKSNRVTAPPAPSKQQQQRTGMSKFGFGGRTNGSTFIPQPKSSLSTH